MTNKHFYVFLFIAFNKHTGSAIILQWDDDLAQAAVTIALASLDLAVFPTFYLPKGIRFTHIKLHPHTMTIFLLGDQLWYSHDQGANFYPMWKPDENEVFYSMYTTSLF